MAQAARELVASPLVSELKTSRLYETPPIGGPQGQDPFINAAAAFRTNADARQILELLQRVEQKLGRQRRRRWDARSIDLDVVLHGDSLVEDPGLIIPHPRYTARQFVLQPACEVAPDYRDPRFGWSLQTLTAHLQQGVPSIALVGGSASIRNRICHRLQSEHDLPTFLDCQTKGQSPITPNQPEPQSGPTRAGGEENKDARERSPSSGSPSSGISASGIPSSGISASGIESCSGGRDPVVDVDLVGASRWVSAFVPKLPEQQSGESRENHVPRLIARIRMSQTEGESSRTEGESSRTEGELIGPPRGLSIGRSWPEYQLEVDDLEWAVSELISALDSMRCPVRPISDDIDWWR